MDTEICRFFQSSKGCFRGESCTFRHERASPNGQNASSSPLVDHGNTHMHYSPMNPYANGAAPGASTLTTADPITGAVVTPCRFYQTAAGCRNGTSCSFAHMEAMITSSYNEIESGMMMMSMMETNYYGNGMMMPPAPAPVPVPAPVTTTTTPTPSSPDTRTATNSSTPPRRRLQIQPNPSKKNYEVISEITPVLTREIEGPFFAIDVECVATGHGNNDRDVARIAVVDEEENVFFDRYVKPDKLIVSYLTQLTGITESDLVEAPSLAEALVELRAILPPESVIVGQSIKKDLEWLGLEKEADYKQMFDVADLFRIPMQQPNGTIRYRYFSLRHVAKYLLGHNIQEADHDPVIDAKYAMKIFKQFRYLHETPAHRDAVYQTLLKTPRTPSFAERFPVIDGVAMRAPRKMVVRSHHTTASGSPNHQHQHQHQHQMTTTSITTATTIAFTNR